MLRMAAQKKLPSEGCSVIDRKRDTETETQPQVSALALLLPSVSRRMDRVCLQPSPLFPHPYATISSKSGPGATESMAEFAQLVNVSLSQL